MKASPLYSRYVSDLPIFISMVLASVFVWYFNAIYESIALFLGIIAGGLVDLDNRFTGRLQNLVVTLVCFASSAFLTQITMGNGWLFAVLMTVSAFGVVMVGVIDARYRTIAFGTLLVMLYTVLTSLPNVAWYVNPLMLVCGTLLYNLCTLAFYALFPYRPVQANMMSAYRSLADYMLVKAQFFDPDEVDFLEDKQVALAMKNTAVITDFNQCRNALFYRLRSQYRNPNTARMLQYYLVVQNIHERISSQHVDYKEFVQGLAHTDLIYRLQRVIVLQAQACRDMAESLEQHKEFVCDEVLKRAGQGLKQALNRYLQEQDEEQEVRLISKFNTKNNMISTNTNVNHYHALKQLVENVLAISDLFGRLENIKFGDVKNNKGIRIAGQDIENPKEIWQLLRSHLTLESSVFRHAVRMALISAISCILVVGLNLHFGYWILLTAILVCQPNYSATTTRLKQRVLGTGLGVVVGSALPLVMPSVPAHLFIIVMATSLFFVFRTARYSFSTFFVTVQVLVSFSLIGLDTQTAMWSRLLDTVIGAGLAWFMVSYLWADWHYLTLAKTGTKALQADANYLQQILTQIKHGHDDDVTYRKARRVAHEQATNLSNTVSDMSIEPKKYGKKLQEGFNLLQLNYALISSISALGALREQISHSQANDKTDDFITQCLIIGEQITHLMLNMTIQQPDDFQSELKQVQNHIRQLEPTDDCRSQTHTILWGQLRRISERLMPYFMIILMTNK